MIARKPRPSKSEHEQEQLDEALKQTFPASDTPAMIGPRGGITGTENPREHSPDGARRKPPARPKRS